MRKGQTKETSNCFFSVVYMFYGDFVYIHCFPLSSSLLAITSFLVPQWRPFCLNRNESLSKMGEQDVCCDYHNIIELIYNIIFNNIII